MDRTTLYGPFHRLQSAVSNEEMERTGLVGGKAARNIYSGSTPKVKAFVGPLPAGRSGIEFFTEVRPDPGTPPAYATWSRGSAGVIDLGPDPKDDADVVAIQATITKRADR